MHGDTSTFCVGWIALILPWIGWSCIFNQQKWCGGFFFFRNHSDTTARRFVRNYLKVMRLKVDYLRSPFFFFNSFRFSCFPHTAHQPTIRCCVSHQECAHPSSWFSRLKLLTALLWFQNMYAGGSGEFSMIHVRFIVDPLSMYISGAPMMCVVGSVKYCNNNGKRKKKATWYKILIINFIQFCPLFRRLLGKFFQK